MNENPPFDPDLDLITGLEAGRKTENPAEVVIAEMTWDEDKDGVMRCWVCEIGVSRPEYFTDAQGTTRIVHNWCVAGAETKSRREKAEG